MATLTVQQIVDTGLAHTLAAVNASDKFTDDGSERTFLLVTNGGGGSINVTVNAVQANVSVPGVGVIAVPNIVVAVPNGTSRMIGPFSPAYRDSDGFVNVAYSGTTSVTAVALKVAKEA